jgi:KamA family protein
LDDIPQLSADERARLSLVAERYAFRVSEYYLKLIDWDDPRDPIRQLVIPREEELADWGTLDASNEASVTVAQGIQHKYRDTVLLLCNEVCGAYCRYCFRKRLFMDGNDETANDLRPAFEYIAEHPEVNNVLLSGGDPLLMSTRRLVNIFERLRQIHHVKVIRVGSKMPAFDPHRILDDPGLRAAFREFSNGRQRIYLMTHFDHPRELTSEAVRALHACLRNGVVCANQCPLIKGINDDPTVLAELFIRLSQIGCPQYYVFQGRPTVGNKPYELSIVRGLQIFNQAMQCGAGLARRARFVISHATGKLEVMGVDERYIYLRYHQPKHREDAGKLLLCHRDDHASWFDDLVPVKGS